MESYKYLSFDSRITFILPGFVQVFTLCSNCFVIISVIWWGWFWFSFFVCVCNVFWFFLCIYVCLFMFICFGLFFFSTKKKRSEVVIQAL